MTDETIFGGLDPELVTRVVSRREALRETGRRAGISQWRRCRWPSA